MSILERRKKATSKILLRIAELQIKKFSLKDTPEDYIKKAQGKGLQIY